MVHMTAMRIPLSESLYRYRFDLLLVLMLLVVVYGTIVPEMAVQWYQDDNYSHGFLVPLIAGYFLYQRFGELKTAPVQPANMGLVVIIIALVQLIIGSLASEYFTLRSSLVVLLAGITLYFFGTQAFKTARFPILYLLFMVPLPYIVYDALTFPLKLFVTRLSVGIMKFMGLVVIREGNIIMFPSITLEVADACSGIRSLMSLLAISTAYAFLMQASSIKRWIVIVSALPLALFTNTLRVVVTGILSNYAGAAAAKGFFHEFAGMAVFALAIGLLLAIGILVREKES